TGLEKLFFWAKPLSPYWETQRLMSAQGNIHEVEQVMGAAMLFKPHLKFDEDFFLYCEDTDFCHRMGRLGSIYWVKDAVFEHALGASSRLFRWETVARYNRGKELFFHKHYGGAAKSMCIFLNRVGAGGRLIIWTALLILSIGAWKVAWDKRKLWWRVLFVPRVGPPKPRDA
ncbi:MAG: hypothetical protein MH204_11470, partial [Fimbriimonadaceae bacterium]|nr:hypothetical protein [Fimbriimonadaceae bacterium]